MGRSNRLPPIGTSTDLQGLISVVEEISGQANAALAPHASGVINGDYSHSGHRQYAQTPPFQVQLFQITGCWTNKRPKNQVGPTKGMYWCALAKPVDYFIGTQSRCWQGHGSKKDQPYIWWSVADQKTKHQERSWQHGLTPRYSKGEWVMCWWNPGANLWQVFDAANYLVQVKLTQKLKACGKARAHILGCQCQASGSNEAGDGGSGGGSTGGKCKKCGKRLKKQAEITVYDSLGIVAKDEWRAAVDKYCDKKTSKCPEAAKGTFGWAIRRPDTHRWALISLGQKTKKEKCACHIDDILVRFRLKAKLKPGGTAAAEVLGVKCKSQKSLPQDAAIALEQSAAPAFSTPGLVPIRNITVHDTLSIVSGFFTWQIAIGKIEKSKNAPKHPEAPKGTLGWAVRKGDKKYRYEVVSLGNIAIPKDHHGSGSGSGSGSNSNDSGDSGSGDGSGDHKKPCDCKGKPIRVVKDVRCMPGGRLKVTYAYAIKAKGPSGSGGSDNNGGGGGGEIDPPGSTNNNPTGGTVPGNSETGATGDVVPGNMDWGDPNVSPDGSNSATGNADGL